MSSMDSLEKSLPLLSGEEDYVVAAHYAKNEKSSRHIGKEVIRYAVIGTVSLCILATGIVLGMMIPRNMDKLCSRHIALRSPITDNLDITYHNTFFNLSLFKPTIYAQEPSPAVDAAWKDLGVTTRAIQVDKDTAERAHIPLDRHRLPDEFGGGYVAYVEGLHQLHCLDLLRKTSYYNYEYYLNLSKDPNSEWSEFDNGELIVKYHMGHCLDLIRQQLMCTVDTSIFGQLWIRTKDGEAIIPDFNHEHRCKNFDAVKEWAMDHQIKELPKHSFPGPGEAVVTEWP